MKTPKAEKIRKELIKHNHLRIDNYYWLKERNNPKVIEYLESENEYTDFVLKDSVSLRENLFNEMIGRIKQEDSSVPYKNNGYYYYHRYEKGTEYPVYCRKKETLNAPEEIILDVNELAKGYKFFNVTNLNISPDNKKLSYGVDKSGGRQYEIHFKDLNTGSMLPDIIPNTTGNAVWTNDNKTIYYSQKDHALRPFKIFKHSFGNPNDVEIFHEKDEAFGVYVYKTKSKKFIIIGSYSTVSNEYRIKNADNQDDDFSIFQPREKEHEHYIDHLEDNFYIITNLEAKNFRLMKTSVNKTLKENWIEIIPHRNNVLLERIEVFKDYYVIQERTDGVRKLKVFNMKNNSGQYIQFNEDTYVVYLTQNYEINTDKLRFVYSSLTTPDSTYDYNMKTGQKELLKREEVVGSFNPDNYKSERLYATAADGTMIPISLVYKKGMEKFRPNPLFLNGYGSYGISNDPYFSSIRLSLLDRGFIVAIAHIRGGQEMGREWYEDGKLIKKKNTFTDFIACADFLVDKNYTSKEKLFASGTSAGGLLMGAVVNMRPDLFKGIIAGVPFVDVLTTMLDENIPLTTGEFNEWGNPADKKYYDYIFSYSPYDNVEKKVYPAMLVTAGLHDSQVQYWEPAKWVAKLRSLKTDNYPLLLYTNMSAGHGGASGRFEKYKLIALEYSFILGLLESG